jgi:hypothetical protein
MISVGQTNVLKIEILARLTYTTKTSWLPLLTESAISNRFLTTDDDNGLQNKSVDIGKTKEQQYQELISFITEISYFLHTDRL